MKWAQLLSFPSSSLPNTPVFTTVLLRWNVSPKLPLASSVKQGNDTKYKNGGLYMIYRVTELLKIHAKFSGVSVEMFVWFFWVMCDLCYFFVLLSVKNGIPCGTFFHAFVSVQCRFSFLYEKGLPYFSFFHVRGFINDVETPPVDFVRLFIR